MIAFTEILSMRVSICADEWEYVSNIFVCEAKIFCPNRDVI